MDTGGMEVVVAGRGGIGSSSSSLRLTSLVRPGAGDAAVMEEAEGGPEGVVMLDIWAPEEVTDCTVASSWVRSGG